MPKKSLESSVQGKPRKESVKFIPDSLIDFSDIPELTDEDLKHARRVGRPKQEIVKEMISIRIDPKLLTKLRKLAAKKKVPYQTLLHDLLEDAVNKAA